MTETASSALVFAVHETDFADRVLETSQAVPVLVDFWAPWCAPCRMLAPLLEQLAERYRGKLLIAKVNTDAEPALAASYHIRALPTVKLFRRGQVIDEFSGLLPPAALQAFAERHIEKESDIVRNRAAEALAAGDAEHAKELLIEARGMDPDNPAIVLELADVQIKLGHLEAAETLLKELPANATLDPHAKAIAARLAFLRSVREAPPRAALADHVAAHPEDIHARYVLGLRELLEGRPAEGLEQLLEVLRRDRNYQNGLGRQSLLAAFDILGEDHALTRDYRRKLALILH